MPAITQLMWVYVKIQSRYDSETRTSTEYAHYGFSDCDMSEYGYAVLGQIDVTFTVPDGLNPRVLKAQALEKQLQNERAKFQLRVNELQRQISECLALEAPGTPEFKSYSVDNDDDIPF